MTELADWIRVLRESGIDLAELNKRLETSQEYRERLERQCEDMNCYGMVLRPGD